VPAGVPCHDGAAYQPVDVWVVRAACRHILELLPARCVREAGRIRVYLGYLASGGVGTGTEVGQVTWRYARLSCPTASVAADVAARGETTDKLEESLANRHVLEHLSSLVIREARGVGYNLGKLASGDVSTGLEGAIWIAVDDA